MDSFSHCTMPLGLQFLETFLLLLHVLGPTAAVVQAKLLFVRAD
jgi:hypothetical protein